MKISGVIQHYILGKSIKDVEVDRILDKIHRDKKLSDREKGFLELYNQTSNDLCMDFMYLSKNLTYNKIELLLENRKNIICDLSDRDGKIGLLIESIDNDHVEEVCVLNLRGAQKFKLHDKFLYNILYDMRKDRYSLQEQGEYYEKVNVSND